jgi:hypothetical protein
MENVVGKTGLLTFHGVPKFRPLVRVLEVRIAYGRERYRVEPVSGEGLMTVDSSRVELRWADGEWPEDPSLDFKKGGE